MVKMHTENKHLALKLYSAISPFTLLFFKKVFILEFALHLVFKLFIKKQLPRALLSII